MDPSSAPNAAPPPSAGAARRAARLATPRLQRELNTLAAMLRIYCRAHHVDAVRGEDRLCAPCGSLFDYARERLAGCPFGPEKPTCVNCQIHCYGPAQREATRAVMRYAGPRMLWRHPLLALAHLLDGRRLAPPKPRGVQATPAPPPARAGEPGPTPGRPGSPN